MKGMYDLVVYYIIQGGYVFAPDGRCMYEMEDGEEGMLVAKIQLN